MTAASRTLYLDSYLAPFAEWLAHDNVTDLYVNRPGELWVEALGAPPVQIDAPGLTRALLARLVRQIAAISAQGVNREHPLLAASLPTGERVQAAIPPATRGEIALAIRKHITADLSLDDYARAGAAASTRTIAPDALESRGDRAFRGDDAIGLLRDAVRARRNILVSGGTSSGKTTFVNALMREIPPVERLIAIEDTAELRLGHANSVGLIAPRGDLGEASVTAEDLLIASLRMRPDRIILGEIRGQEAVTFLRAINTGHPGSMGTIHADNPVRAIDQLALLVLQTGSRMAWDDVIKYVRSSLDVIVQLRWRDGQREIESILLLD